MFPRSRMGKSSSIAFGFIVLLLTLAILGCGGQDEEKAGARGVNGTPTSAPPIPTRVPPTQAPTSVPPTSIPPTQVPPEPSPTEAPPAPPPAPLIRSCAEIRATGTYLNDEERAFFLANCLAPAPTPAPAPSSPQAPAPPPPAPIPPAAIPCSAEASYVSRGSAAAGAFQARVVQYLGTPSYGALNDLYELANVFLGFANALDGIEPVPDSCRAAHDRLVGATVAMYDVIMSVQYVSSLQQFLLWLARYDRAFDTMDAAFSNWLTVTGIRLPSLGGLR